MLSTTDKSRLALYAFGPSPAVLRQHRAPRTSVARLYVAVFVLALVMAWPIVVGALVFFRGGGHG